MQTENKTPQNFIKKILIEEKLKHNHTNEYLAKHINENMSTIRSFFRSEKGSLEIACKLLEFYDLSFIRKNKSYMAYLKNEKKIIKVLELINHFYVQF